MGIPASVLSVIPASVQLAIPASVHLGISDSFCSTRLTVGIPASFNLIGRGGGGPDKVLRELVVEDLEVVLTLHLPDWLTSSGRVSWLHVVHTKIMLKWR